MTRFRHTFAAAGVGLSDCRLEWRDHVRAEDDRVVVRETEFREGPRNRVPRGEYIRRVRTRADPLAIAGARTQPSRRNKRGVTVGFLSHVARTVQTSRRHGNASRWRSRALSPACQALRRSKRGCLSRTCLESLPILLSDPVRAHPGRPAALPKATGWDEELLARTAGVRLPRQGHSESSFRTDPSVCPIMLRHRYR